MRGFFFSPSLDGGLELFELSRSNRRRSSATTERWRLRLLTTRFEIGGQLVNEKGGKFVGAVERKRCVLGPQGRCHIAARRAREVYALRIFKRRDGSVRPNARGASDRGRLGS